MWSSLLKEWFFIFNGDFVFNQYMLSKLGLPLFYLYNFKIIVPMKFGENPDSMNFLKQVEKWYLHPHRLEFFIKKY